MEWFNALEGIDKAYVLTASLGAFFLLLHLVLTFFGGDLDMADGGDIDLDFGDIDGHGASSDVSFKWLSIQGISGFFLMFGLVGLAMRFDNEAGMGVSLLAASMAGLVTAYAVTKMFAFMKKFESSGTLVMENAVGQEGRVYLSIPADRAGKVEVPIQGRLQIFDAVSEQKIELPTGTRVKVDRVIDGHRLSVTRV